LGLHFDVFLTADASDDDDELLDALDHLRETAAECCFRAGMRIALGGDSGFLAVLPLPGEGPRELDLQASAVDMAAKLLRDLNSENRHPKFMTFRVTIHKDSVDTEFVDRATEFVGGPLLELSQWVCSHSGLFVTDAVISGLEQRIKTERVDRLTTHL